MVKAASVLHGCEFVEVQDITPDGHAIGPRCGAPGRLVHTPMGRDVWVCDEHAERLSPEVTPGR